MQLLGNHELMELQGHYDYARDGPDGVGFGSLAARHFAMQHGEEGAWLRNLPVMHRRQDVVFMHGGLTSPTIASLGTEGINFIAAKFLSGDHNDDEIIRHITWSHGCSTAPEQQACPILGDVLHELGAKVMVVGHTNGFAPGEIGTRCAGRLQMIDVGMSSCFVDIPKEWRALHIYEGTARAASKGMPIATPAPSARPPSDQRHMQRIHDQQHHRQGQEDVQEQRQHAHTDDDAHKDTNTHPHRVSQQGSQGIQGSHSAHSSTGSGSSVDPHGAGAETDAADAPAAVVYAPDPEQERLEREALAEALAAPRLGLNGKDRTTPSPRDGSGAGRRDYLGSVV